MSDIKKVRDMLGLNARPEELREKNNGYNPENLESFLSRGYTVIRQDDREVLLEEENGNEHYFVRTYVKNEVEYIEKYEGIYGIEIDGIFYTEGE